MALCKILIDYPNAEGWKEGDVVDISSTEDLIAQGKVELHVEKKVVKKTVKKGTKDGDKK